MMKACEWCRAESIHYICVESANEDPIGIRWFCSWDHLLLWIRAYREIK
jgi:hypothetical protein